MSAIFFFKMVSLCLAVLPCNSRSETLISVSGLGFVVVSRPSCSRCCCSRLCLRFGCLLLLFFRVVVVTFLFLMNADE